MYGLIHGDDPRSGDRLYVVGGTHGVFREYVVCASLTATNDLVLVFCLNTDDERFVACESEIRISVLRVFVTIVDDQQRICV